MPDTWLNNPLAPMSAAWPAELALAPHSDQPRERHEAPLPRLRERDTLRHQPAAVTTDTRDTPIRSILALARFAPSGDNTQPWRFEIVDDQHLVIHGFDTRDHCVYDLRGHASQIALGALLETLRIAATAHGRNVQFLRRADAPDDRPVFDAFLTADATLRRDPLVDVIEERVTQRRPLRTTPLTAAQIDALESALPPGHRIVWRSSFRERLAVAALLFRSAHIRLTTREAYETHRKVIQWNATLSEDRIPDRAVGVDAMTRRLMRWAMQSWSRITFLNRFLAGTIAPRLQLDFLPGLRCAAHFFLIADKPAAATDDFVAAGRALQRFWLTATQQGLLVQPEMTPLIFSQYDRQGIAFTESAPALRRASRIRRSLESMLGADLCERAVFMGRIGNGRTPDSRSVRLPLNQLMIKEH